MRPAVMGQVHPLVRTTPRTRTEVKASSGSLSSVAERYMEDANGPARALVLRLGGIKVGRRQFPDGLERDVFQMPRAQGSED